MSDISDDDVLDIRTPTAEEIREHFRQAEERKKEHLRIAREKAKNRDEPIGKQCPVCGGEIMVRLRRQFTTIDRNTPIGGRWDRDALPKPARPEGYHCAGCAIEFNVRVADNRGESEGEPR